MEIETPDKVNNNYRQEVIEYHITIDGKEAQYMARKRFPHYHPFVSGIH